MFTYDTIFYVGNPKELTKKVLEVTSDYSKVAKYKVNTQKLIAFLYTSNEQVEFEIRFSATPIKIPASYFVGINKVILKFV